MTRLLAPRYWWGHILLLVALAAATLLGLWQLHTWEAHRAEASRGLSRAGPVSVTSVIGPDSAFPADAVGKPVRVNGRWLPVTWYVDRRVASGESGYWVVSPVLVGGSHSAIPVVRGMARKPHAPGVAGSVGIEGWLEPGEAQNLPDPNRGDRVLPELATSDLVQDLPEDLYSAYVVSRSPEGGLAAARPPKPPDAGFFTGLRNFLYAFQWWVFGGFAAFVWWRWCRDELAEPATVTEEEREPADV